MPLVSCPKCPTKLRVPEGTAGNAQCPKCNALFPVYVPEPEPEPKPPPKPSVAPKSSIAPKPTITPKPPAPKPAAPRPSGGFEVVDDDDEPASPPPPKSAARPKAALPKSPPPPPPKPLPLDDDEEVKPKTKRGFEVEDEEEERPSSKRRRDDDDDEEDDRPRKKNRRDEEDDEDDRPRSKRRRNDDDDDDDRPRRRRRDYDDDEEEDDWHRAPKKKGPPGYAAAKTGVLLLNISFWLHGVSLALMSFFIFLGLVGAFDQSSSSSSSSSSRRAPRGGFNDDDFNSSRSSNSSAELLIKLPGLLGISNWVVAGVGFAFCIAGPVKARSMAITAASLAGAHLILVGVTINDLGSELGGYGGIGGGADLGMWLVWPTTLPILDTLLPIIIMGGAKIIGGSYIVAFLAAGCELARMIFAMLLVKRLAESAKDYDAEEKAQMGVMGAAVAAGGSAILALAVALLAKAGAIDGMTSAKIFYGGSILLIYVGFTLMNAMPILSTMRLQKSLARKARGK